MQTFLPYSDFSKTAAVLDMRRLGKQRVENLQIMKALADPTYGWQNHPAVRMWRGFDCALFEYHIHICYEWTERGYKDTCLEKGEDIHKKVCTGPWSEPYMPPWMGSEMFHRSHRSNLIRKDATYYRPKFGWMIPDDLEYVWPVL